MVEQVQANKPWKKRVFDYLREQFRVPLHGEVVEKVDPGFTHTRFESDGVELVFRERKELLSPHLRVRVTVPVFGPVSFRTRQFRAPVCITAAENQNGSEPQVPENTDPVPLRVRINGPAAYLKVNGSLDMQVHSVWYTGVVDGGAQLGVDTNAQELIVKNGAADVQGDVHTGLTFKDGTIEADRVRIKKGVLKNIKERLGR